MSEFPPPTGPPVAFAFSGDPWAEQARRHHEHVGERRARRRRLWVRVGGPLAVATIGAVGGAVVLIDPGASPAPSVATPVATPVLAPVVTPVALTPPETNPNDVRPDGAAVIGDVWLLDRGDGQFDWGAIVESRAEIVRRDLDVTVVVRDDDGAEVFSDQVRLPELSPDVAVAVGGVFTERAVVPTRIEVTSTIGTAAPGVAGSMFDVAEVRRVPSGQVDRDDRLLGNVSVDGAASSLPLVRVAALWRDGDGVVIAALFDVFPVVRTSTGVEADFAFALPRAIVPAGDPDDVVVSAVAE